MYNDLQDALGYRADQNAPFNPTYTVAATATQLTSQLTDVTFAGTFVPGGVQPDMYTPTVETWSLRVERELSPNTSLTLGYVGNHGYHELVGVDENAASLRPFVRSGVRNDVATFPANWHAYVLAEQRVARGHLLHPSDAAVPRRRSPTLRSPIPGPGCPKAIAPTMRCKSTSIAASVKA